MKRFATFAIALAACTSIPALQDAGATEAHPTRNPPQAVHQNPELAAHVGDGDDENQQSKALAITNLDLDVAIEGDTAHTVVTANFANSGGSALEGNFAFDLPAGSVVTGYALDVGDKMVDGVLEGRHHAQAVYTSTARRRVDPGLAEVTRNNAFTTRIFPIMPGKGRTIRFEFATPIDPGASFVLPLATVQPIGKASIHVSVSGETAAPSLVAPAGFAMAWSRAGQRYEARAGSEGRVLAGALSVGQVSPTRAFTVARRADGETFFEIDDTAAADAPNGTRPARLRVYWDTSRSRRGEDHAAELALLRRYVDTAHPQSLDLVLFADVEPVVKTLKSPSGSDVAAALDGAQYRGATSLTSLYKPDLAPADACLLFSDGNIDLDSWHVQRMPCTLFSVSADANANRGFLRAMAAKSSGEFVDLTAQSSANALSRLTRRAPRVVAVTDDRGQEIDAVQLAAGPDRFRTIGKLPASGSIAVKLAHGPSRSYAVDRRRVETNDALAALWAAERIDEELGTSDRPDLDRLVGLSRRYSVATAAADFIVLENLNDYINAKIEPPQSFGTDMVAKYRTAMADAKRNEDNDTAQRLSGLASAWGVQKTWWQTKFKYEKPKAKPEQLGHASQDALRPTVLSAPPPPPPPSPSMRAETVVVTGQRAPQAGLYSNSPVTAVSNQEISMAPQGPQIEVQIAQWNPDRPYLKALDAAAPDTFWKVYDAQERQYGNLPAFYFDAGEYLFRHGKQADAIKTVLNALDLPGADTSTMTILADRLMRYGDETRALWLYDQIAQLETDRPQPLRNLALALVTRAEETAKRGGSKESQRTDYERALKLLNQVATSKWPGIYDGIEVIALMEANHIVPRLKALGSDAALDPRFTALLDVDLRVVLEWNTDGTDMDLWVDEPTGERAIYSNPKTGIGGRLSHDMTNGYGPEEYLLHQGPDGTYTVRVNVYATDRLNPNGATVVRAHVFRDYDRPTEQEQVLELELKRSDNKDDAHLVGTVAIKHAR
jgi:hypothetical protein